MTSVYDSERLAAAYAFDRPPIHEHFLRSVRLDQRPVQALDVGCGAGRSTAALAPLAQFVTGVEPIETMLAYRWKVAPDARFVIGTAEKLPFATGSFDLVTAAGSLNYTDLPTALGEITRVLALKGIFLLYDFSPGRHSLTGDALANWFTTFEQKFPWPPGWQPLDARELPLSRGGHGSYLAVTGRPISGDEGAGPRTFQDRLSCLIGTGSRLIESGRCGCSGVVLASVIRGGGGVAAVLSSRSSQGGADDATCGAPGPVWRDATGVVPGRAIADHRT